MIGYPSTMTLRWLGAEALVGLKALLGAFREVIKIVIVIGGALFWALFVIVWIEWSRMGGLAKMVYGSADCAALHAALNEDPACRVERVDMPVPPTKPWEKP